MSKSTTLLFPDDRDDEHRFGADDQQESKLESSPFLPTVNAEMARAIETIRSTETKRIDRERARQLAEFNRRLADRD